MHRDDCPEDGYENMGNFMQNRMEEPFIDFDKLYDFLLYNVDDDTIPVYSLMIARIKTDKSMQKYIVKGKNDNDS